MPQNVAAADIDHVSDATLLPAIQSLLRLCVLTFPSFFVLQNYIFSFLLSSRIFIQPHELLDKLIKSVPENDESLERLVVLIKEWTRVSETFFMLLACACVLVR